MNIADLLLQKTSEYVKTLKNNSEQLENIAKVFKEDDASSFDSAGGFEDFIDGGNAGGDFGADQGGFDDFGGSDFGGDPFGGQDQQGQLPLSAVEYLENLDESEVKLVEDLVRSYSSLYEEQKLVYQRLLIENLDITEFREEASKLKEQYGTTLKILREYIVNKYHLETTVSRVETFVEFKFIFENLSKTLNSILGKLAR